MRRELLAVALVAVLATSMTALAESHPSSCVQYGPHTADAQGDLLLAFGGGSPDVWNVKSMEGSGSICAGVSGISSVQRLSGISITNQIYTVIAYPHIGYGYGEFDTPFGRMSPGLAFPMPVASFDSGGLTSQVNFTLSVPKGQPMDFAYDLWIEGSPQVGHKALVTDLEVMVWLYNQTLGPAGTMRGSLTTSAMVNGQATDATWSVYANNASSTYRELVTYLLKPTMEAGSISLDLRYFVDDAVAHYWHPFLSGYSLMGVELGTEFGASSGTAALSWNVYDMDVQGTGPPVRLVG